jgi:hypothetical protein
MHFYSMENFLRALVKQKNYGWFNSRRAHILSVLEAGDV